MTDQDRKRTAGSRKTAWESQPEPFSPIGSGRVRKNCGTTCVKPFRTS